MTQPAPRVIELRRDIPCTACAYNLRGLAPQGRCPECGQDVSVSLAEHVVPDVAAASLDPRWRRQMIEAVLLAFLGLACGIASVFDWPRRWEWSRTGPNVPIVLASAWWVLQWYSALKLTRPDPATRPRRRDLAIVWLLRIAATAYLAYPALVAMPGTVSPWLFIAANVIEYSGMVAAAAYFARMRFVFTRVSSPTLAAQATLVACLMPLVVAPWALELVQRRSWQDLLVLVLPSFQFGFAPLIAELLDGFRSAIRVSFYLPLSLAAIALSAVLLFKLLRSPKSKSPPEATAEESPTSSSP